MQGRLEARQPRQPLWLVSALPGGAAAVSAPEARSGIAGKHRSSPLTARLYAYSLRVADNQEAADHLWVVRPLHPSHFGGGRLSAMSSKVGAPWRHSASQKVRVRLPPSPCLHHHSLAGEQHLEPTPGRRGSGARWWGRRLYALGHRQRLSTGRARAPNRLARAIKPPTSNHRCGSTRESARVRLPALGR